ncbi:aldehyde ferredoxin oxidoreductase family protein [Desulfovibrio litoralis]|uniref:Aldehyde:ferredoxin oxidoreductase n=1 Tax=Desulfovibrio litoralis DSM 11393 TaxID=1121455 RepID=A0A1M7RYF5_9BACT|nr:aldehyde ferredoxin oxidoreductase family protein [Desulfovibrio litoralis]SHN51313.1 aldehyde:ferredoxin oxidoreductase [Desulfovibrio litoralis DSM 11393]
MFAGGYWGKILRVNLTTKTFTIEDLPEQVALDFLGGMGFAVNILYNELKPKIDPLSPENKLVVFPGPFTGTNIPCSSRIAFGAKSPQTGTLGVALSGGHFPAEFKFTGFDGLIVEGKSEKPCYILIRDGKVTFRSAKRMWGSTTSDCQIMIKNDLNDHNVRIACIGPAGENMSRMAAIINERRAAGRKGLGAVMGSKNLKAIVVRGNQEVPVANKDSLKTARLSMAKSMKDSPVLYPQFSKLGTAMVVDHLSAMGMFPSNNWKDTGTNSFEDYIGVAKQEELNVGKEHCYGCPVGCTQQIRVNKGPRTGVIGEPEYESFYSLGSTTGIKDVGEIAASDRLCDELGLDTISAGVCVGFAMELAEKGLLDPKLIEGLDLRFGNADAQYELIRRMAFREGIGDLFADGTKEAARRLGGDAWKYAIHVKGLELPAYDGRGAMAHALNYATAFTGADHNRGYAIQEIFGVPVPYPVDRDTIEGKGKLTKWNQDIGTGACDCPTTCAFMLTIAMPGTITESTAALASALTGLKFTSNDIWTIGERVNNLAKAFNSREGFGREDDTLPWRLMNEALQAGLSKGGIITQKMLDAMLDEYYTERGWDLKTSRPTKEKLQALGLDKAAKELWS